MVKIGDDISCDIYDRLAEKSNVSNCNIVSIAKNISNASYIFIQSKNEDAVNRQICENKDEPVLRGKGLLPSQSQRIRQVRRKKTLAEGIAV